MIRLGHKKPPVLFALVDIAVFSSRAVTTYLSTREVKSLASHCSLQNSLLLTSTLERRFIQGNLGDEYLEERRRCR